MLLTHGCLYYADPDEAVGYKVGSKISDSTKLKGQIDLKYMFVDFDDPLANEAHEHQDSQDSDDADEDDGEHKHLYFA